MWSYLVVKQHHLEAPEVEPSSMHLVHRQLGILVFRLITERVERFVWFQENGGGGFERSTRSIHASIPMAATSFGRIFVVLVFKGECVSRVCSTEIYGRH
jgi:hypothetical protein